MRSPGYGGLIWTAVVGAVIGYVAAAVIDGVANPGRQSLWTTGLVLGGGAALPVLWWLVETSRFARGIGWKHVLLVLEAGPFLLALGGFYIGVWVIAPQQDGEGAGGLAFVGVLVWPMLAGTLRIVLKRPVLRPPWWAAAWPFLGVPVIVLAMSLRSDHAGVWISSVALGVVVLTPIAVWRYRRTRRLLPVIGSQPIPSGSPAGSDFSWPASAYASWGRRAVAFLIDFVIAEVLLGVFLGLGSSLGGPVGTILTVLGVGLGAGIGLIYNRWYLGGRTGQTWGRRVLRVRLVSEWTGQPISMRRAFTRDLAHIITDVATYYVGWLVPLWDAKRQTLADKLVHTVVLNVGSEGCPSRPTAQAPHHAREPQRPAPPAVTEPKTCGPRSFLLVS